MTLFDSVRLALPTPHRAGWPFIAAGLVAAALGWLVAGWLVWVGVAFAACCVVFFRDPDRVPPARHGAILAPADGRVVSVAPGIPPAELELGPAARVRVSIFLSVLDVHVNRAPIAGVVRQVAYRAGKFVSAGLDHASEANERNALAITLADGREVAVVQIAGLIARRILCFVVPGEAVRAGQRFGLIRFGSRTDLYLPPGVASLVSVGQRMVGGETVIAELTPLLAPVAVA